MMVRQRMIKHLNLPYSVRVLTLVLCALFLVACNPTEITSSGQRSNGRYAYDGSFANKAFIYPESPFFTYGPKYGPSVDIAGTLIAEPKLITTKNNLSADCQMQFYVLDSVADCIHSYVSKELPEQMLPRNSDGTWIFPPASKEFYQVNSLYHVQQGVNKFFEKLSFAYSTIQGTSYTMPKSLPSYLDKSNLYWFKAITPNSNNYFLHDYLSIYSQCNLDRNAQFLPAGPDLCFGGWAQYPSFFLVQDPSVIYHELGHALVSIMMNLRNGTNGTDYHPLRSNLGAYGYDEAGAINEGIADYFSFVMNKRTHLGEWALAKAANASRPMKENDPIHIKGIDTTPEGRLSYPLYLHYDPNEPDAPYEDIHYAGQIVSHYLVALTDSLKADCSFGSDPEEQHRMATAYTTLLLAETLSELGDLKARGVDSYLTGNISTGGASNLFFNNLDDISSYTWTQIVNPPTYRRFFQVFAKNIVKYIPSSPNCTAFNKNKSEKLLDDYGLLLFKHYNDNGTSTKDMNKSFKDAEWYMTNYPANPTTVSENNRRKSVLISKELLSLATPDTALNRATYYIIDDRSSIEALLSNLLFKGYPVPLSPNVASVDYNNGNIKISPGEVVAVIPNLYNASNSTMAGVQILANDWDHMDYDTVTQKWKPCVIDDVTKADEGAVTPGPTNTCGTTMKDYKRIIKQSNGTYPTEAAAPVCMVRLEEGEKTTWISQNDFRKKQGLALNDKDCLGFKAVDSSSVEDFTFNPHECLVRMLPGVNRAFYSKIEPQKSYVETVRNGNPDHKFNVGNAIIFEVNKWIPPGTKFRCRLRARFSNCSDCYANPLSSVKDDFIDAEYNGSQPYKILNFEFDVND